MREYLVFQLYGPMAAWGDIAVGETRPSALTPAKSMVLGLIAAALGLKRPDTVKAAEEQRSWEEQHVALAQGYGMAVRVHALGIPLSDYHTAEVPKGQGYATRMDEILEVQRQKKAGSFKGTILSRREYRQDSFCGIALWAKNSAPYRLDVLKQKLEEPEFTLYLGRKSCPLALPLAPRVITTESIEQAVEHCTPKASLAMLWDDEKTVERMVEKFGNDEWLLWDTDAETRLAKEQTNSRRDEPQSRRRWQFSVREECRARYPTGDKP